MASSSPIEPESLFAGLRPGAILFGAFVDIAATTIASSLLLAAIDPAALSSNDAAREAIARVNGSPTYEVAILVIGALCTLFGAFIGARRAGLLHVRHGGWIAVASAAIQLLLIAADPAAAADPANAAPLWAEAAGWFLILPAGMAGGALAAVLQRPPRA